MGFRVFNPLERRTALAVGTGLSAQVEATLEVKFDHGSAMGISNAVSALPLGGWVGEFRV